MIDLLAARLFRRHVGRGAEDRSALGQADILGGEASQAEIQNLDPIRDQALPGDFSRRVAGIAFKPDVARFDVPVDQSGVVGRRQPLGDFATDP